MAPHDVIDRVAELIREISATAIEPLFDSLASGDVREKSPGEVVTRADEDGERMLTAALAPIVPGAAMLGEEACTAAPGLLDALGDGWSWLIDPLDGTSNFVAGSTDWAVMVALVRSGETVASWIWRPATRRMYMAERGSGATCNGQAVRTTPRDPDPRSLRGAVLRRFLDPPTNAAVERNSTRFAHVGTGRMCAGSEYPAIADGEQDFVVFWRTLPWDHAPGALLVQEAGGVARRPDGTRYVPSARGEGLVVAADEEAWPVVRSILD
ncbi:MAG TPA: inositol monophosphatase [Acidimicrobiales bacterium]